MKVYSSIVASLLFGVSACSGAMFETPQAQKRSAAHVSSSKDSADASASSASGHSADSADSMAARGEVHIEVIGDKFADKVASGKSADDKAAGDKDKKAKMMHAFAEDGESLRSEDDGDDELSSCDDQDKKSGKDSKRDEVGEQKKSAEAGAVPMLWPPNKRMVAMRLVFERLVSCEVSKITSSEPEEAGDIELLGGADFKLRADRLGTGEGRIYTVKASCKDAASQAVERDLMVMVPHDLGKGPK